MAYSSHPEGPSVSQTLIRYSSQVPPQRASRKNDGGSAVKRSKSDKSGPQRIARKHLVPPTTYLPTSEELDRIERMMALRERLANINKMRARGHTYGKLTVSGNARAVQGNIIEDSSLPSYARDHTYGQCEIRDDGMVWSGDVYVTALRNSKRHSK